MCKYRMIYDFPRITMFVGTGWVIREYFLANNLNSGQNLVGYS